MRRRGQNQAHHMEKYGDKTLDHYLNITTITICITCVLSGCSLENS